ncbi:MAG TPA: SDR family NAD(P)-dependent oxidoreductase [Gaiellales bacterium]|nr:SDR family NAD(P)-dependent oxidoreductase [Gaiellales bacterium]
MPPAPVVPADTMRLEGIEGRVAVVTGAGSGIGLRVAETLRAQGARVAGVDVNEQAAGVDLALTADVRDEAQVDAAFARAESDLGPVDVVVTCAGVFTPMATPDLGLDEWRRTIDINLTGTFLCARRGLGPMRERGYGRIVTISSGAGLDGGSEECAHYAASKGGVIALTKALAKEYVRDGVLVNVVAPRAVRTPMLDGMTDGMDELVPVGRIGEPDDVAAAVAFLCSAHASYVSGEVVVLNGGWW